MGKVGSKAQVGQQKKNQNSLAQKQEEPIGLKIKDALIGEYSKAPKYMKDNEAITGGYRINFNSPWKIFKSLFMVHNESVNIWSHFVPAIIICIAIVVLLFLIDKQSLAKEFQEYHQSLSNSFQHYTNSLDNLTLIQNMKHMKNKTKFELQQLQQNVINSYLSFSQDIDNSITNLKGIIDNINMNNIEDSLRTSFKENIKKLETIKNDYEKVIAPALVSKINSLDNKYLISLKDRMNKLQEELDSDRYKYIDVLHEQSPNPHKVSRWPIIVFLSSAFICLMCSTLFHLFYPMSSASYKVFSRFDYAGISMLIAGSTFPPFYYGMYCYFQVFIVYEIIELSLAVIIFILSVFEWMHRPENANYKALIYGGFGVFNVIPVSHLLINSQFFNSGDGYSFETGLPYFILLGASYLFGLYVYTARCPERQYPGKFNYCGHSHQFWHMFVVIGIILTYMVSLQNYEMRKNHACPISASPEIQIDSI